MITFHSLVCRYNDRFSRWYAYTDSGLLIYLDFSLALDKNNPPVSANSYKVTGKLMPSPRTGEGNPIAIVMVVKYEAFS